MVFNNVTDALRLWCEETARKSAVVPACRAADALGFWLGSLTDAERLFFEGAATNTWMWSYIRHTPNTLIWCFLATVQNSVKKTRKSRTE